MRNDFFFNKKFIIAHFIIFRSHSCSLDRGSRQIFTVNVELSTSDQRRPSHFGFLKGNRDRKFKVTEKKYSFLCEYRLMRRNYE
jgi:hypothetical protein